MNLALAFSLLASLAAAVNNQTTKISLILVPGEDGLKPGTSNHLAVSGIKNICGPLPCSSNVSFANAGGENNTDAWYDPVRQAADDSDVVITLGYFSSKSVLDAAEKHPEKKFVIVDYDLASEGATVPANVKSVVFNEAIMGYLAGVFSGSLFPNGNGTLGVIGGQGIPATKRFVNGYAVGVKNVCANCTVLCGYSKSFSNDNDEGTSAAELFLSNGVDAAAHHAGSTGTAFITRLTDDSKLVIGFGTDEYDTNFASGNFPGSKFVIASILKRYDVAVNTIVQLTTNATEFTSDTLVLSTSNGGISVAPCHDACTNTAVAFSQTVANEALLLAMRSEPDLSIPYKTGEGSNGSSCDKMLLKASDGSGTNDAGKSFVSNTGGFLAALWLLFFQ